MFACLLVCLDWPLAINSKWAHWNISGRLRVHVACVLQLSRLLQLNELRTCVCMFACLLVCLLLYLLGPTTCHKFQMSILKYFGKIECPRCTCTPAQPYCVKGYCQTQAGCVGSTHSKLWINLCMLWVWLSCIAHARVALVAPPAKQIAALMCGHLHLYTWTI